jgi:hypothetical protein
MVIRKNKYFEKNFGTKNTQQIRLNSKNLKNQKSKKSDLLNGTTRPSYIYARKNNYPAACGETTEFNFVQKPKKAESFFSILTCCLMRLLGIKKIYIG